MILCSIQLANNRSKWKFINLTFADEIRTKQVVVVVFEQSSLQGFHVVTETEPEMDIKAFLRRMSIFLQIY